MTTAKFCGNPQNHESHEYNSPGWGNFVCDGVARREVEDSVIIRKEPEPIEEDLKEDPTIKEQDYDTVSVHLIVENEDERYILSIDRAMAPFIEFVPNTIYGLDEQEHGSGPVISKINIQIEPEKADDGSYYRVERVEVEKNDEQERVQND